MRPTEINALEWKEEQVNDRRFTLFCAETPLGDYYYGTDMDGKAWFKTPDWIPQDADDEVSAREAAERAYYKAQNSGKQMTTHNSSSLMWGENSSLEHRIYTNAAKQVRAMKEPEE